jgi:hypothetical protein
VQCRGLQARMALIYTGWSRNHRHLGESPTRRNENLQGQLIQSARAQQIKLIRSDQLLLIKHEQDNQCWTRAREPFALAHASQV